MIGPKDALGCLLIIMGRSLGLLLHMLQHAALDNTMLGEELLTFTVSDSPRQKIRVASTFGL